MPKVEFDLIVYGATGFTGSLVAEYLLLHYGASRGLNWALAGRSMDKLQGVRQTLGMTDDFSSHIGRRARPRFNPENGAAYPRMPFDRGSLPALRNGTGRGLRPNGRGLCRPLGGGVVDARDD